MVANRRWSKTASFFLPLRRPRWEPVLSNGRALVLFAPLLLLLLAFVFLPLIRLVISSLTSGEGIANYADVFQRAAGRRALITTIVGAILVTVIAVPIGALLSWYLVTQSNPWIRGLILLSVLVPVWMGTVVKNYAIILLVARNGALNKLLGLLGLGSVELLYTAVAVVIGMVYTMVPYAVLSLYGVFVTIDQSLVSAARNLGASRLHAIRTVVLPLAAPGIMASAALVFAISLGFYVTPVLLGGAQAPFMASLIRDSIFSYFNLPFASAASVVLLGVAIAVLGLALWIVGRERLMRAIL